MGLEINAYQAAVRSSTSRLNSDFDSEMMENINKMQDAVDDLEIFATASIEDGLDLSDGLERDEMLLKLGEVLSHVCIVAWELGVTLDKVAFKSLNNER